MSQEQFDKKLDHLARKAAEQGHIPYTEEAWNKMENLLDKDDKRRRFFAWWWSLPLLLLVAGVGYWVFSEKAMPNNNNDAKKMTAVEKDKTSNKETALLKADEQSIKNSSTKVDQKLANTTATPVIDNASTINNNKTTENNSDKNLNDNSVTTATHQNKTITKNIKPVTGFAGMKKRNIAKSTGKRSHTGITNAGADDVIDDNSDALTNDAIVKDKKAIADIKQSANVDTKQGSIDEDDSTTKVDSLSVVKKDIPVKKAVTDSSKTDTIAKASTPNKTKKHGFEFSLLVAGDATTAAFKRVDYISGSVGVGIAYKISSRLSLATGLVVSNKLYKADTTTYKNVQRPSTHYYVTNIDARCLVLDVPINIQYKISEKKNSSWYAIAGLSTYFMKKEKYDYNYIYYNQPKMLSYTINNENKHWLSVLNLSAAYRRSSTKGRLAWQLAPYAKIPLTGIGEGKVKLYSVGLSFSMLLLPKK